MATEGQIQKVLANLADVQACDSCGTRFRFGDLECPHCGADLEEYLRLWAEDLINELDLRTGL
jgi:rubrerythrin